MSMCFGQGYIHKAHNKREHKLKEASKGINMQTKVGILAMWFKVYKETVPLSLHQLYTS